MKNAILLFFMTINLIFANDFCSDGTILDGLNFKNKNFPNFYDGGATVNVTCDNNTLIFRDIWFSFNIDNLNNQEKNKIYLDLKKIGIESICSLPGIKELMSYGINVSQEFYTGKAKLIFKFIISSEDCH